MTPNTNAPRIKTAAMVVEDMTDFRGGAWLVRRVPIESIDFYQAKPGKQPVKFQQHQGFFCYEIGISD